MKNNHSPFLSGLSSSDENLIHQKELKLLQTREENLERSKAVILEKISIDSAQESKVLNDMEAAIEVIDKNLSIIRTEMEELLHLTQNRTPDFSAN